MGKKKKKQLFSWEALLDSFSYEFTKLQGKIAGVNHFIRIISLRISKLYWIIFLKISFNVNLILAEIP